MSAEAAAAPRSQYVDFWNTVLVPKFVQWRHILVGGLTLHSAKVFPSLAVKQGDSVVDAGCGFGDTAIQLARLVGPSGSVLGMDCCDGFLDYGREDAKAAGLANITSWKQMCRPIRSSQSTISVSHGLGPSFLRTRWQACETCARASSRTASTMIVWRGIKDNPWLGFAKQIVLQYLPPPGENAQTCGPGPFSMADMGVVTKQLEIAGYREIKFE